MTAFDSFPVAHVDDAAWLIALWLAIHGGDPGPDPVQVDETTMLAATTMVSSLSATHGREAQLSFGALKERLQRHLGIEMTTPEEIGPGARSIAGKVCFKLPGGKVICIFLVPEACQELRDELGDLNPGDFPSFQEYEHARAALQLQLARCVSTHGG